MGAGPVNSVLVACSINSYTLGGTVSGLTSGALVLSGAGQTQTVLGGATNFVFPSAINSGTAYAVNVQTQPSGFNCSVSNGSGTVTSGNVTSVAVTCLPITYTVGGAISGLGSNSGLVLSDGTESLSVSPGSSAFVFPTALAGGTAYSVAVQTQPSGLTCSVSNGSGVGQGTPVTSVSVNCQAATYTIGGSISGLSASGLTIGVAGQSLPIASGATSFVTTPIATGTVYSVVVQSQPTGGSCSVTSNGSGTLSGANVTSVGISCVIHGAVSTLAGGKTTGYRVSGSPLSGYVDGTGLAARFQDISSVAVDASGNIFVADRANHVIRKVTPAGDVSTFAGSGTAGFVNGTGTSASFYQPYGVALDSSSNLYVADLSNNAIRKITPAGVVTTVAGSGVGGYADGTGAAAMFNGPYGLTVDGSGNIFVADTINNRIRKVTPSGVVTTVAGNGFCCSLLDGTGTAASFQSPADITVDGAGNLYVADSNNHAIRKITPSGVVTTIAGSGVQGFVNGTGTAATFQFPSGLTLDAAGNLFVGDYGNNVIRKITPAGVVSTFAGSVQGYIDGTATAAQFSRPRGLAFDANGYLYVADSNNFALRVIAP